MIQKYSYSLLFALLMGAPMVLAQSINVQFPIAELGNCDSQEACAAYCDVPENGPACLEFGKKQGLVSDAEAKALEALPDQKGPGGCASDSACRQYCSDPSHTEECIAFAEEHNIGDQKQLQRAKEFIQKTGPGGCRGPNECRSYCEDPAHQNECIDFAEKNGFMSSEEAARARKFAGKTGPGGCRGQECKAYCEDPAHIDECLAFAEENNVISKEDAARVRKIGLATGPGGCKGEECRSYCEDPAHQNECIDFAEKNGLMSSEEAARARKFAGKTGPGGCRGEACRVYCEDPAHQEECLEHAEREGLMSQEEILRAKKFLKVAQEGGPGGCKGREACEAFCRDPQNQDQCFEFAKKQGFIRPEDEKNFEVGKKLQAKLKEAGGPGGCKEENECRSYCTDPSHTEECIAFASAHGGIPPEDAQRMLKEFTEKRFENRGEFRPPEDFQRFEQEARQRFEQFRQLEQEFRGRGGFGFPGEPGGFSPSGPGGPGGQEGQGSFGPGGFGPEGEGGGTGRVFVGPGGCSSPTECIKFCSSNPQECFQSGPPSGQPGAENQGGFGPQGPSFGGSSREFQPQQFIPQLKTNLRKEIDESEIPQNFGSEEEKQNFFRQKFEEFQGGPGRPQEFPGRPPEQFPGQGSKSEFPGRFPEQFPGQGSKTEFPGGTNQFPPTFRSEAGQRFMNENPDFFKQQFNGGQQQMDRQMLEQKLQQREGRPEFQNQPFNGFGPKPGTTGIFSPLNNQRPGLQPPENFHSPEEFKPPTGSFQQFQPGQSQPSGSFQPPPSGTFEPQPSSFFQPQSSGESFQPLTPSGTFQSQPSGSFQSSPPPSESFSSPPPSAPTQSAPPPPPPSSRAPQQGFFANFLNVLR